MQFMTALFGESTGTFLNMAFALGIVLVLIVIGTWLLKLATQGRDSMRRGGGQKRLSVVDSAVVDGRRRVLIVRRDNVEHLIMTGGPQDLLIESGIVPPEPAPQQQRRSAARQAAQAEVSAAVANSGTPDKAPVARKPSYPPLRPSLPKQAPIQSEVIPISPAILLDNSTGAATDSARTGVGGTGGHAGFGARNRFFRLRDRS